jgi:hypothetical protein
LVNERPVHLTRRQPEGTVTLGAAHHSMLLAPNGSLVGYTDLTRPCALPTENEARRRAYELFAAVAPDLALTELWVAPHEERILLAESPKAIIGQKVKCRQADGRYAWAIVGDDVITFERDVVWNDAMSERVTQKWLHDDWLRHQLVDGRLP